MDEIKTNFLQTQEFQLLVWFRYVDNVFFIWTHCPDILVSFMTEFNKENITLFDLNFSCLGNKLTTDLCIKSTDKYQYLHYAFAHPAQTKRSSI